MRKSAFLPWLALALGAVGALIRRTELNTVFDPSSGLPKSGAGVTVALIVLSPRGSYIQKASPPQPAIRKPSKRKAI